MERITTVRTELTLQEMLDDPIVHAVMACDGVTRREVEQVIQTARGIRFDEKVRTGESARKPTCCCGRAPGSTDDARGNRET